MKVLVVGGGGAGLAASAALLRQGHEIGAGTYGKAGLQILVTGKGRCT